MVQRGRVLRLAAEPQIEAGVAGQVGAQHLDGHVAVKPQIARQMDLGHAAKAEDLTEFVPVGQVLRGGHCHVCSETEAAARLIECGPGADRVESGIPRFPLHHDRWMPSSVQPGMPAATRNAGRLGDGFGDRRRRGFPVLLVLCIQHDQDRDDDRQRAEHACGPQQRALAGRKRRRRGGGVRWLPVAGRGLGAAAGACPVRSRRCAGPARPTGTAAGAALPMEGALIRSRRTTAGAHSSHGVGERPAWRAARPARRDHRGHTRFGFDKPLSSSTATSSRASSSAAPTARAATFECPAPCLGYSFRQASTSRT